MSLTADKKIVATAFNDIKRQRTNDERDLERRASISASKYNRERHNLFGEKNSAEGSDTTRLSKSSDETEPRNPPRRPNPDGGGDDDDDDDDDNDLPPGGGPPGGGPPPPDGSGDDDVGNEDRLRNGFPRRRRGPPGPPDDPGGSDGEFPDIRNQYRRNDYDARNYIDGSAMRDAKKFLLYHKNWPKFDGEADITYGNAGFQFLKDFSIMFERFWSVYPAEQT